MRQNRDRNCETLRDQSWDYDAAAEAIGDHGRACCAFRGNCGEKPAVKRVIGAHFGVKAGVDGSWSNERHANAAAAEFGGQGFGERADIGFARVVGGLIWAGHIAGERGDVDDATACPRFHGGKRMARQASESCDVEIKEAGNFVRAVAVEGSSESGACAVDEDVEESIFEGEGSVKPARRIRCGNVEAYGRNTVLGLRAEACFCARQARGVAGNQNDGFAFAVEFTRNRQAEAGRASSHDNGGAQSSVFAGKRHVAANPSVDHG